jgi:hypothetical protein
MTRPGIVGAEVGRHGQTRSTHLVLLLVEVLQVLRQNTMQLSCRDVDTVLPQLLQQQRLRDVRLVVLIQPVPAHWAAASAAA